MLHAISFDVEEYFQVANLRGHFAREDWESVPSRVGVGMDAMLGSLGVANKDVPDYEIFGGVPARKIGQKKNHP